MRLVTATALALATALAPTVSAQIDDLDGRNRNPYLESELAPLGGGEQAPDPIEQVFPRVLPIKRPVKLMPPRSLLVVDAKAEADPRLGDLDVRRREAQSALRAARRVADVRAMSRALARHETLRQERLEILRSLGSRVTPAAEPATPEAGPTGDSPVLPLPTLPKPKRPASR